MRTPFVMVAPNGARRGKADHLHLPITTDEILTTARSCHAAGADGLHLHVRDAEGHHSLDVGRYRETLQALDDALPSLRVQITTEAAGRFDVADQLACLTGVRPGWASVAPREIARSPELAARFYGAALDQGTEIQHILFDLSDIALLADWRARGIVQAGQDSVLLVLGRYSGGRAPSRPADLVPLLASLPRGLRWMLCAFGPDEHRCLQAAALLGGDLRVGFENSLEDPLGRRWTDNAASVAALMRGIGGALPDAANATVRAAS